MKKSKNFTVIIVDWYNEKQNKMYWRYRRFLKVMMEKSDVRNSNTLVWVKKNFLSNRIVKKISKA